MNRWKTCRSKYSRRIMLWDKNDSSRFFWPIISMILQLFSYELRQVCRLTWHIPFPKYCNLFSTEAWPPPEKISAWDLPFPRPFPQENSRCLMRTEFYLLKSHDLVMRKFPLIYPLSFSTLSSLNNAGQTLEMNEKQQPEQPVESWATELGHGLKNCCRIPFSFIYDQDFEGTLDNNGIWDPKYDPSSRPYFLSSSVTWLFYVCLFMVLWRDTRQQ